MGDNGRQGETRPREGGHRIQHRHTCERQWETMGDKGDKTSGRRAYHPTKGNKKEDKLVHKLGDKRDKNSGRRTNHPTKGNKKGDNGRQGGRRHTIQQRETRRKTSSETIWETSWKTSWETRQTKTSGRRARHPTKGNK